VRSLNKRQKKWITSFRKRTCAPGGGIAQLILLHHIEPDLLLKTGRGKPVWIAASVNREKRKLLVDTRKPFRCG
jgi:hypothetical protein